jgi:HEAT repeat protein
MKQHIFTIIAFLAGAALFAQSDEMGMWNTLYDGADSQQGRLVALQQIIDAKPSGAADLFVRALDRLVKEYPNVRDKNELAAADSAAVLLSQAIGEARRVECGPNLWLVVQQFQGSQDAPLVRAEALAALGKIKSEPHLPQVVQLLKDLNSRPPQDRNIQIQNERVAYGAILSLESYGDPSGYLPVFFASIGWYNERIKNQASIALPQILNDPTDPLNEVITSPGYGYDVKHTALRTEERSQAPESSKARTALAALTEGWKASTTDVRQRGELSQMRKLAISMIRRYGIDDAAVYPQLDNSYKRGLDMQEKLDTVRTLGALGTEDAARLLASYVSDLHQRRQAHGLTRDDESLIREVIPALGQTKKSLGRPALLLVQNSTEWTGAIQRLAANALRELTQ